MTYIYIVIVRGGKVIVRGGKVIVRGGKVIVKIFQHLTNPHPTVLTAILKNASQLITAYYIIDL